MSHLRSAFDPPASQSLRHLVEHWAQRTPEGIAITAPGRAPLTYRRLLARIDAVAEALVARGVGPHDRVAIALPNGPETAVAFLGVASSAACAPLNPAYRASEASTHLTQLRARALIVASNDEIAARSAAESLDIPVIALAPRTQSEAGVFELEGPHGGGPMTRSLPGHDEYRGIQLSRNAHRGAVRARPGSGYPLAIRALPVAPPTVSHAVSR